MSLLRLDPRRQGLRILLVEEDEDDYGVLRDLLREMDLPAPDVDWVSTYEDAIQAIRERRHDLYLLDYRLGARTGADLLEEVSLDMAAVPVIMLTGSGYREADERALAAGASDFLTKGEIEHRDLQRAIRYAIQGKRTEALQRFLSEATRLFNASLEYGTTVGAIPRVVVSDLADWSCLYMPAPEGPFRMAEVVHRDPEMERTTERLAELILDQPPPPPVQRAMEEGTPIVLCDIRPEHLEDWFEGTPQRSLVTELEPVSAVLIPLQGKAGVLGVLALVSAEPSQPYRKEDLDFFRELGRRVTMALENARLFETAREASRTRDELMSMVSHDLGNPLAAISIAAGRIESLLDVTRNEEISRFTEMIRSAASSMERLLEDLLEVGRLETGHFGIRRIPREVNEILELAHQRFAPRAEARGIALRIEKNELLPDVLVDLGRIDQVLSNLLNNALKFTEPGGSIRVEASPGDGHVRISVSDTGGGIGEEEIGHLFDRFWQSRRHRRAGAGLGLTIAKEIIEAHGGEIWARSREGEGSTFLFTLPVAESTDF